MRSTRSRHHLFTVCLVAVLATACGPDSQLAAAEAGLGADLPVTPLEAQEEPFESIGAMARAFDPIVVGLVSSVKSLGTPDKGEDPHASEYFAITIETETALKGHAPGRITLAWEGFVTDGAGTNSACRSQRCGNAGRRRTAAPLPD